MVTNASYDEQRVPQVVGALILNALLSNHMIQP